MFWQKLRGSWVDADAKLNRIWVKAGFMCPVQWFLISETFPWFVLLTVIWTWY